MIFPKYQTPPPPPPSHSPQINKEEERRGQISLFQKNAVVMLPCKMTKVSNTSILNALEIMPIHKTLNKLAPFKSLHNKYQFEIKRLKTAKKYTLLT